ncbi:hypothetical protein MRB53_018312 [Persea americana]|uniref:Uncharacterized protein n=1 Tax=Persea americana TaxID=3435 RepID=A0ACC2M7M9_PERAE|nr:hypothetical protein MRB53_018312 [Persea americana]
MSAWASIGWPPTCLRPDKVHCLPVKASDVISSRTRTDTIAGFLDQRFYIFTISYHEARKFRLLGVDEVSLEMCLVIYYGGIVGVMYAMVEHLSLSSKCIYVGRMVVVMHCVLKYDNPNRAPFEVVRESKREKLKLQRAPFAASLMENQLRIRKRIHAIQRAPDKSAFEK